jgi:hypothetical protein
MRMPGNKTSISTTGAVGSILLVSVIWDQLSAWWLILSIFLIIVAIGNESGKK